MGCIIRSPTMNRLASILPATQVLVHVDATAGVLSVTPLFSWREDMFVRTFAERADARFSTRSALERAVLGLVLPHAVRGEAEFLRKNDFRMQFHEFDWRLNDLATR